MKTVYLIRFMSESSSPVLIRTPIELREALAPSHEVHRQIALVPTMGSLHEGHLALVREARRQAEVVVVSLFVNPTQFGPNEDYAAYPREENKDIALLSAEGVDFIFIPEPETIYPRDYSTFIHEEKLGKGLCGVSRPHHFRGVLTIVAKLFNLINPQKAVFGQKDAQQCAVIKKMVADLNFPVEIIIVPTVREEDGLAMSSRNRYLTNVQREDARIISRSLFEAKKMVENGVRNTDRVIAEVTHRLAEKRRVRIIYANIVHAETLETMREIVPGQTLLALAVWVDEVRLIDNIVL